MGNTDELIIDRVLDGDKNAYAYLVDRYKDRVYSLVAGIIKEEEKAKEIAQDVFIKAYRSLSKFRRESSFSTWIYRIAYNSAVSETRKKKYLHVSFDDQLEKAAVLDIDVSSENDSSIAVQKSKLQEAINRLTAEERLIIMLYYFEEQSVEEISRSSGLSKSNVKTRLHRLRNKLKEILGSMGIHEPAVY